MNRKRSLSIDMIRRLHQHLGISADVLIRPARENAAA
jgi:HTH-type transcriptional regulator/antitoxin HigA